jgi:hypothetical protein
MSARVRGFFEVVLRDLKSRDEHIGITENGMVALARQGKTALQLPGHKTVVLPVLG